MNWLKALTHLAEQQQSAVLITLVAVRGHAPREAGAKMVVSADGCWDSIGGGNLEATAIAKARALLRPVSNLQTAQVSASQLLTLRLSDSAPNEYGRQCCGGEVTLLLEPVLKVRPSIALFGMGHIGLELALILSRLPINLYLIDSRESQLSLSRLSGLQPNESKSSEAVLHIKHSLIPELELAELPTGTHLLIFTHDHAEDAALCDAALRRPDLGFIGLIGSASKWGRFRQQLKAEGHSETALARITTPIGLAGIGGKRPAEIAISVAAQLLQVMQLQVMQTQTGQAEPNPSQDFFL